MEKVRIKSFTEFRGAIPEVPIREGVDMEALLNGDEDPFFLTLEIAREDAVSNNNLLFDESLVDEIVSQINTRGVEGIMGHLKFEDLDSAYPVSDVHWIGAIKSEDGKAWAKGYIPRTAAAQREHFRILKATNGKAATSIFGMARLEELEGGVNKAHEFQLEQLDLAPYARAALPPESDFTITKEMTEMGDNERIAELEAQLQAREDRLAELEQAAFEKRIAEVTHGAVTPLKLEDDKAEALRTVLCEMIQPQGIDEVESEVNRAWELLNPLVEMIVEAQTGGSAISSAIDNRRGRISQLEDTPEARAAARSRMGV